MRTLQRKGPNLLVSLPVHKAILIWLLLASLAFPIPTLLLTHQLHPHGHLGGLQMERTGSLLGPLVPEFLLSECFLPPCLLCSFLLWFLISECHSTPGLSV